MIPQTFEYAAPNDAGRSAGADGAMASQAAGRRHEPDPDDEAAAGRAGATGGPGPHQGPELHSRRRRTRCTSAPPPRITRSKAPRWCAANARCWRRPRRTSAISQVRNTGTIGGSIAHADPSADYPAALQALEAKVVLKSAKIGAHGADRRFLRGHLHHRARARRNRPRSDRAGGRPMRAGVSYQKMVQPASRIRHRRHRRAHPADRREGHLGAHRRHWTGRQAVSRDPTSRGRWKARPVRPAISRRPRRWWRRAWKRTPICTLPPTIASTWRRSTACGRSESASSRTA